MTSTTETPLAADFAPATEDAWMALVAKVLKGGEFEKRLVSRSADGLRLAPLYTRKDVRPKTGRELPGAPTFARGFATTYARGFSPADSAGWDIRAVCFEGEAKAANAAILAELDGGATAIALMIGDGPGRLKPSDIAPALEGVLLDLAPVSLAAGEGTKAAAEALAAVWAAKGIAPDKRLGHFGADPLGWLAATGGLSMPVADAMKDVAALIKLAAGQPGVTAALADGVPYHNAGASEAQEIAAVLSTLVAYLRAAEAAGIAPAQALPRTALNLAADADQILTIAKLRACRRLAGHVAQACGAGAAASSMRLGAVTSMRMMSRRDPWVNMLRTTIACAAAAMGGADAITVLPFTIALGKPDAFARRIARNTHIVLQEESGLGRVADPAGGSFAIERITDDLAAKAWAMFQELEAEGGMIAALTSGHLQDQIEAVAADRMKRIATGREAMTGVSAFPRLGDDGVKVEAWTAVPAASKAAAIRVRALKPSRLAAPFEALRDAADAHAARTGAPPRVFLASLGATAEHSARTTWIRNLLAAGGIESVGGEGWTASGDAARAFADSGASIACICGADDTYKLIAEATAQALKGAGATEVLLAGRPGDLEAALKSAGVDGFLAAGQDMLAALGGLQTRLGVGKG